MIRSIRAFSFGLVATCLLGAVGAKAQVTAEDAACRAALRKNAFKLGVTTMRTIDACIKDALAGNVPADKDCNTWTVADSGGQIAGAIAKLRSGIHPTCLALPADIVAGATQCPSPGDASDAGGATDALDTLDELADCQGDINTEGIEPLRKYILSPSVERILAHPNASNIAKCANAIGKGATKLWSVLSKERGKCQSASDEEAGPYGYGPGGSGCYDYDRGRIASAVTKLKHRIKKACGDTGLTTSELALLGTCGDSNITVIQACVPQAVKKKANGVTASSYEFTGVCPVAAKLSANAGAAGGEVRSRTSLDTGWTGLGHDAEIVNGFAAWVNLDCSDDCGSCAITANCDEDNCRCNNDPSIRCHTPFATGGVCGGTNVCDVHFGPPLPLAAGGVATCVTNIIKQELVGSGDAGRGTSMTEVKDIAKVFLGISQTAPCPTCTGATVGANGICNGGQRNGLACETSAVSPAFGNVSYDCPPELAKNATGAGLELRFSLTSGSVSLPFGDACDSPLDALNCACGACSLNPLIPCQTDDDCLGFGTCNNAGGPARQPNACSDLNCSFDADAGPGEGSCDAGPTDRFCDGALKGNGDGFVTCASNADCAASVGGTCSLSKRRPCFLDPIAATGVAGTEGAELVTVFCSGPTTAPGVNAAGGIPGPTRLRLDLDYTTYCPDRLTHYEFNGANCP